ncbi:MAG: nucleoside-diphosphate sugar epimerase/dehydratase [Hyphomicrobium sp.]
MSIIHPLGTFDVSDYGASLFGFVALFGFTAALVGLNRGIWRYASFADLQAIILTSTVTVAAFAVTIFLLNRLNSIPRSTLVMCWLLTIALLSGSRIAYRGYRTWRRAGDANLPNARNVLLIGASENAEHFIKAVNGRHDTPYTVVGIVDDRGRRVGQTIRGVRVLGSLEQLDTIVARLAISDLDVDAFVLTTDGVCQGKATFERLASVANALEIELLRLPELGQALQTDAVASKVPEPKPIILRDLLPRKTVSLDVAPVKKLISGSRVIVTGAGGSIGSELCRQLIGFGPRQLLMIDSSEYLLYSIQDELSRSGTGDTELQARLGNVRDRAQIFALFKSFKPDFVFHAAALKHVPMVEVQPLEGLLTNVVGTRNVADASVDSGVRAMVMVSTDKAVNPSNVMGASKRLAESYCQSHDCDNSVTRFITVRFGNVVGSAGSVVPLFQKQIAVGGPVTVTHPEIERYFMTIPEATELILQAAARNLSARDLDVGKIFVLDMGPPVKILDVARKMIRLSGREPDTDIEIKFVGLRPGEKMFEELFLAGENIVATEIEGLLTASPKLPMPRSEISRIIDEIEKCFRLDQPGLAIENLQRAVPEYSVDEQLVKQLAASEHQSQQSLTLVHPPRPEPTGQMEQIASGTFRLVDY